MLRAPAQRSGSIPGNSPFWFAASDDFDNTLRAEFGPWLHRVQATPAELPDAALPAAQMDAITRLGLILLCDQLPRNLYRGSANAYSLDSFARALSIAGIEIGQDRYLSLDERAFFYLPLEHSESLLDQHACVGLFTALRDSSNGKERERAGNYLRHAHQHRDIIQRFGRFPHRNRVIGRASSDAEAAFASRGGFGQPG